MGSVKIKKMAAKIAGKRIIMARPFPATFSASSWRCSPRRIDIKAVAPIPIKIDTAIKIIIIGKATVVAAIAS